MFSNWRQLPTRKCLTEPLGLVIQIPLVRNDFTVKGKSPNKALRIKTYVVTDLGDLLVKTTIISPTVAFTRITQCQHALGILPYGG